MNELDCYKPGELLLVGKSGNQRADGVWSINYQFIWIPGGPLGAFSFDTAAGFVPFVQEATE